MNEGVAGSTGLSGDSQRHHAPAERRVAPVPAVADLHTHTLRSDGLLRPATLAAAAAAVGVRLLAITDHDTLAGVREVRAAGDVPPGLELVPGIEINAVLPSRPDLGEGEVHVLGLGVDPDDEALEAALSRQRDARRKRFERLVRRLRDLGLPIDDALETLPPTTDEDALGRPRVARALVAAGHAASVEDAFNRYLSRGRPAYVPRRGMGPVDAIQAIRAAGGLASLAHFAEAPDHLAFLRELADAGLEGLEVHYRAYAPDVVDGIAAVAAQLRLVPTGGTDYHGDRETYAEAHAALWFPEAAVPPVRAALAGRTMTSATPAPGTVAAAEHDPA